MPTKRLCATLLMTLFLLSAPSAHAEIYRWVDANGMTHFSDKAPKSHAAKVARKAKVVTKAKVVRDARVAKKKIAKKVRQKRRTKVSKKKSYKAVKSIRVKKPIRPKKSVRAKKPTHRAKAVRLRKPILVERSQRLKKVNQTAILTASLDAAFYDIEVVRQQEPQIQQPERKVLTNIKQSLCMDKRLLLAALQEKGFESYYDESGEYRVAWGVEDFYRGKRRYLTAEDVAKKTKGVLFEVEQYCDDPYDQKQQDKLRADWVRAEYCNVSKAILEDIEHPFMRASDKDIRDQTKEVERFCSERHSVKDRNDERYYPKSLQVKRLQQKHFLYR